MNTKMETLIEAGRAEVGSFVSYIDEDSGYTAAQIIGWSLTNCDTFQACYDWIDDGMGVVQLAINLQFLGIINFVGLELSQLDSFPGKTKGDTWSATGFWFVVEHCLDLLPDADRNELEAQANLIKANVAATAAV